MLKKYLFIGVLLAFCLPILTAQKTQDWIFKNEKDGVKVYYRKTADIHELKLKTSIKVSLSGLVMLLSEVENYPKWAYKVAESRELKKISPFENYYYSRLDFPWPLDDRDLVVHSKMEQDPVTRRVTANSIAEPDFYPAQKNSIRIQNARTSWTLVPGTGGWTYVEYYIYSDPGGSLPDWLVNMALEVGPMETIKNIRNFVKQDKYQTAKLAHLKD